MKVNPLALLLIALATAIGALFGVWLIGLIIGLGIVTLASFL